MQNVALGNFGGPNSATLSRNVWETVAVELNAAGGAFKTAEQWKKSWSDWKCTVKKQQAEHKRFKNRTGNLPSSEGPPPMEEIDCEILQFFPSAMVKGDGRTKEPGFTELQTREVNDEDTAEEVPYPKASTSRAQSNTFSSCFAEIKRYIEEQDDKQTKLLTNILQTLRSIDESLKPVALNNQ